MGRKKQGNGRDSRSKRRGTKVYGGQTVTAGSIIVRQKGSLIVAGKGAGIGRDHTIFALVDGVLEFTGRQGKRVANIIPSPAAQ